MAASKKKPNKKSNPLNVPKKKNTPAKVFNQSKKPSAKKAGLQKNVKSSVKKSIEKVVSSVASSIKKNLKETVKDARKTVSAAEKAAEKFTTKAGSKAAPAKAVKGAEKAEKPEKKSGKKGSDNDSMDAFVADPSERIVTKTLDIASVQYNPTGESICREVACEALPVMGGYCRLHYIKNWKKIKRKEVVLRERKLNRYIEELIVKYPDKYIEAIREDLVYDKSFNKVITELELEEPAEDFELETESDESLIENIRRDSIDEDGDVF